MTYLSIPNWKHYQHYRDRTPVWVKLHLESLRDEKLRRLSLEARLVWHEMLKLAGMFQNAVPNSPETCGNLAGIAPEVWREAVAELLKARLLREKKTTRSASKPASAEKEKEKEEEKERAREASPPKPVCDECELPWPHHLADCPQATPLRAVS